MTAFKSPREIELKCQHSSRQTAVVAAEGGGRAATVRYEDEKNIRAEHQLRLVDADDGDLIVAATVVHVRLVPVWKALDVVRSNGAVYGTRFVTHLLENLNQYHDDVGITDEVKVVIYEPDPRTLESQRNP